MVTVEPGVYLPGELGVRIEDLVLVLTDAGREILTGLSKELTVVTDTAASASTLVAVRRTEQRRAAIWALYQSDLLGRPLEQTFPRDVPAFTRAVAQLVRDHQAELDELIRTHASGWSLERIAPLERSILRVGLAELLLRRRATRRARRSRPRARSTRPLRPPSASAAPRHPRS